MFSRKLRELRQGRHLTQVQLAEQVGMTRQMISYLEAQAENPTANVIRKFADFFEVSADVFLYEDVGDQEQRPGPKSTFERQIEQLRELPQARRKLASDLLETVLRNAQHA